MANVSGASIGLSLEANPSLFFCISVRDRFAIVLPLPSSDKRDPGLFQFFHLINRRSTEFEDLRIFDCRSL